MFEQEFTGRSFGNGGVARWLVGPCWRTTGHTCATSRSAPTLPPSPLRPRTFHKAGALRRVAPARQQLVQKLLLALHRRPGVYLVKLQAGGAVGGREASGQQEAVRTLCRRPMVHRRPVQAQSSPALE